MRVRRKPLRTPLAGLAQVFHRIREAAGVHEGYAPDVSFEAEHGGGASEPPHVTATRLDRTSLPLVTIDPEGSHDLDQALLIERRGDGHRVYYAIADVAAHVVPEGPLDRDTHTRVETVYCPDRRVGLHPPVMSEGYASLLPGQRTKAALWTIELDAKAEIREIGIARAWVSSRRQYSYEELSRAPGDDARALLGLMREVGDRRRALARERGAVTLPKPEQEFIVEEDGVTLTFRAATPVEDDNAQISLLTGEAAARLMLAGGIGILRTMPPADERSVTRLRHQARALGISWDAAESYADCLAHLDLATPAAAAFLSEATTLFRGARWEPFDDTDPSLPRPASLTHGALGVPYAHVTAPLRRLADRYATEICLAHAGGVSVPAWVRRALSTIGDEMEHGTHIARSVDHDCISAVESAVLAPYVGTDFQGVGLDDRTVQLAEPAVVARCEGGVEAGKDQTVRLVSADLDRGPVFAVENGAGA
jgi:exoribonuclease R